MCSCVRSYFSFSSLFLSLYFTFSLWHLNVGIFSFYFLASFFYVKSSFSSSSLSLFYYFSMSSSLSSSDVPKNPLHHSGLIPLTLLSTHYFGHLRVTCPDVKPHLQRTSPSRTTVSILSSPPTSHSHVSPPSLLPPHALWPRPYLAVVLQKLVCTCNLRRTTNCWPTLLAGGVSRGALP